MSSAVTLAKVQVSARSFFSGLLLFLIQIYWWTLSPLIGGVCRFHPSCSRYTATCIERFGAVRGGWLGVKRICRCHPFNAGGIDLPPDREPSPPDAVDGR